MVLYVLTNLKDSSVLEKLMVFGKNYHLRGKIIFGSSSKLNKPVIYAFKTFRVAVVDSHYLC